jgi:hypothetical protein
VMLGSRELSNPSAGSSSEVQRLPREESVCRTADNEMRNKSIHSELSKVLLSDCQASWRAVRSNDLLCAALN